MAKIKPIYLIAGIIVLMVIFMNTPKKDQTQATVGTCSKWRILSYPSWVSEPGDYVFNHFNIIYYFNIEPQSDGSATLAFGDSYTKSYIQKAHANNVKVIAVVGGWGYAPGFNGATSSSNRAKFVSQIKNLVSTYGFDGISIDWEEDVNNPNLIQTMKDLRASLNTLSPAPVLSIDVCCDVMVSSIAEISPYVDSVNTMEYETTIDNYYNQLVSAGVPSSKILYGLGFYAYTNSETRARTALQFVIDHNLKGIEVWDSSNLVGSTDVRMLAISSMLGNTQPCGFSSSGSGSQTCTPNWQCGSWSACSSNIQTRTCTDSNACGTSANKPSTSQSCGTSCTPNWQTGSWSACANNMQTRTVTDSNNCGITTGKPITSQTCTVALKTMTRTIPTTGNPNQPFSITYTVSGVSGNWGTTIEDSISGGCKFPSGSTSYKSVMLSEDGLTKTVQITAPSSGSCTFTGDYKFDTQNIKPFETSTITFCVNACTRPANKCTDASTISNGCGGFCTGQWTVSKNTNSDANCDNKVDRDELGVSISKWLLSSIQRDELGQIIEAWANG